MYLHKILYILNVLNKAEMLSTWMEENDLVYELKQTKKDFKKVPEQLFGQCGTILWVMLKLKLHINMHISTLISFLFVHSCPGCAALTKSCSGTFLKSFLFVSTHQQGHFPPFMCWASQLYWVHSEYTIFYEDTMCATKKLVSSPQIVEFLDKAVGQTSCKLQANSD